MKVSPAASIAILPGYPMLALSAVRLFGPPPAVVLMAYCANETLGVNKTSAKAIETHVGKLWRCMFTSPPCQQAGQGELLPCFWCAQAPPFRGQAWAAVLCATIRIQAAG